MKETAKQICFDKKLVTWGESFLALKEEYKKVKEELGDQEVGIKEGTWNDLCKEFQYTNNKFWRKEL